MARNEQLLKAIEEFQIDDPESDMPFSARLARDMNWSTGYALRVIDEYRRFIYLAMVCDHPVTPSEEVDQVWHLHLAYTRSYWDDLCGKILGRPLHHGPTRGGRTERDRYDTQYRQTLASYESHFATKPPTDIWPMPEERFRHARYVIFDRETFWLAPRLTTSVATSLIFFCGFSAFSAFAIARSWNTTAWAAVVSFVIVYGAVTLGHDFTRRSASERKNDNGSGCGGAGCGTGASGCSGGGCGGGCS